MTKRTLEYTVKKPAKVELWQKIEDLGTGCEVHKNGLDEMLFYPKTYCPFSEWYEKKNCKHVPGYAIKCLVCKRSVTKGWCEGHKPELETDDVVVLCQKIGHELDYGYGYTTDRWLVFSKATGEHWHVDVDDYANGWRKKTLQHIKENGFKAKAEILA
jgi:hypothetical protein